MPRSLDRSTQYWRWYCVLAALEAGAAVLALLALPREGSALSPARVGVLAFLLGALLCFGVAAARLKTPPKHIPDSLPVMAAGLALVAAVALYLLRFLDPITLIPYYQRLGIPLFYLLALCLQALIVLSALHLTGGHTAVQRIRDSWPRAGILWVILLAVLAVVSLTGLGTTPDPAYWGEPGVTIQGWQLAVAILCGALSLLIALRFANWSKLDIALAAAIWFTAVLAWLLVPLDTLHNSFYAPIRPPANVPFPNSDAGYYDSMAQSLLIGYPYQGEIPARPLYVLLLAGFHVLLGERYNLIIAAQSLVLAFIPVLVFWLGRAVHSRPAGVIAAVAAIGREWTSLMVSSATRVSNTKMLLVDLPTLLAILACCLLVIRWMQRKDVRSAAIAGGAYAVLLLLRTQTLVLLPILLLFGALAMGIRQRATLGQLGVFLAATTLTLSPWLLHNYRITGSLSLDAPFQYRIIASQYRYTGNLDIQDVGLQGKSVLGTLLAFAARDPKFVLGFIANHALATQVSSILALPRFHAVGGLLAGVEPYWANWNGTLDAPNLGLVALYLGIIALGISSAWSHVRWAGLVPLGLSLGYALANGIARFSGWRYDLPADWIGYFYFALGVAEILLLIAAALGLTQQSAQKSLDKQHPSRPKGLVPVFVILLVVGALPWIGAQLSSPRYAWATPEVLASRLSSSPAVQAAGITPEDVAAARSAPGAAMSIGRILYPRFFSRGTGLASAHPWPAYAPRDFPRLGFLLLNATRQDVLLPTRVTPAGINHGADAIVLGCRREDYIEARLVLLPESDLVIQAAPLSDPCD
jgi:hypothetical protein